MNPQLNPLSVGISKATQEELKAQFDHGLKMAAQQDRNAPKKTLNDYINEARQQVNELLSTVGQMRSSLTTVGDFAPFFDINFLKREGVTDIAGIDQEYMLTIGKQLLNDYHKFDSSSKALGAGIQQIKTMLDGVDITNDGSTSDQITEIVTRATILQTEYVEWGEQFQRIMMSAMVDIANHLNPLRPPENRITL